MKRLAIVGGIAAFSAITGPPLIASVYELYTYISDHPIESAKQGASIAASMCAAIVFAAMHVVTNGRPPGRICNWIAARVLPKELYEKRFAQLVEDIAIDYNEALNTGRYFLCIWLVFEFYISATVLLVRELFYYLVSLLIGSSFRD